MRHLVTNDRTHCCVGVAVGEEILSRVPHYGLQRTDFRIVMTCCILIISRFLMRIYRCPNHNARIQSSFTRAKERPVKLFESFFGFFLHVRPTHTATHVRARESEGTACVVVVSGTRFESFFIFIFARTATHVRARESEGMACVVVSGTRERRNGLCGCCFWHAV